MVEFTGERVIPGQVDVDLWNEHLARYSFAARYAAGQRVLDAGCGAGYGTAELARTAARVTGIDASAGAVGYAREHYAAPNVEFLQASCTALPVQDASIDLAVVFEVIEHLADWRSLLAETRRILAPAGRLIISTPNKAYYAESRGITGPNPYHVHEFEFEEFSAELRRLFPHVRFVLQNHVAAIGFQPLDSGALGEIEFRSAECSAQAADAHFYVAMCSFQPLPAEPAFFYLPSAANVLREREIHIEKLEAQIEELRAERAKLTELFRTQTAELERSNAWAQEVESKLHAAQDRIVQLQKEVAELSAWATGLEKELEQPRKELAECVRLLDIAENTVKERTAWALELQQKLDLIKDSRLFRLARALRLLPRLPN